MARLSRTTVCCAVLMAALIAPTPPAQAASPPMVKKLNKYRAAHGLPALRAAPHLRRTSKRWGVRLMRTGSFGHIGVRSSRRFPYVGEVLALHYSWKPRRSLTVRRWLGSPAHRAAVLSPSFRYVGASMMRGRLNGRRATIWVVQFGRP